MIYGYARISKPTQNIERQIRNIKQAYPTAVIFTEAYTGTTIDRPEWSKLLKRLKSGDVLVFDSVSRMSRTAAGGFQLYKELHDKGVLLTFLKEPHIDSTAYTEAIKGLTLPTVDSGDKTTDTLVNAIMKAINDFMMAKIESDILRAFQQAEREVLDLHQRTKEGIETARLNGKQIGRASGTKVETEKGRQAKALILKHSIDFGGSLTDSELIKLCGVCRNTFYSYKRQLKK